MRSGAAVSQADDSNFDREVGGPRYLLLSIHPQYAELILSGTKRVELRRRIDAKITGCQMLIYATLPVGAVVGRAVVSSVRHLPIPELWSEFGSSAAVPRADFFSYYSGLTHGYAVELSSVHRYFSPVPLGDLRRIHGVSPPQSYRFLDPEHSLAHHERN